MYSVLDFKWFSKIFTSVLNFQKANELSFNSNYLTLKIKQRLLQLKKKTKNTVPISLASPPANVKDINVFGIF